MSVIAKYPYINENGFADVTKIKHYSDEGKQIIQAQTGRIYTEAVDVYPCKFKYYEYEEPEQEEIEEGNENET